MKGNGTIQQLLQELKLLRMFAKVDVKNKDVYSTRTSLNVNLDPDGDIRSHIYRNSTLICYFISGAPF